MKKQLLCLVALIIFNYPIFGMFQASSWEEESIDAPASAANPTAVQEDPSPVSVTQFPEQPAPRAAPDEAVMSCLESWTAILEGLEIRHVISNTRDPNVLAQFLLGLSSVQDWTNDHLGHIQGWGDEVLELPLLGFNGVPVGPTSNPHASSDAEDEDSRGSSTPPSGGSFEEDDEEEEIDEDGDQSEPDVLEAILAPEDDSDGREAPLSRTPSAVEDDEDDSEGRFYNDPKRARVGSS